MTWDDLHEQTRAEVVAAERVQARDGLLERRHTILGGGLVEERVYEGGRLVDIRRFTLGGGSAGFHNLSRRYGGKRLA